MPKGNTNSLEALEEEIFSIKREEEKGRERGIDKGTTYSFQVS